MPLGAARRRPVTADAPGTGVPAPPAKRVHVPPGAARNAAWSEQAALDVHQLEAHQGEVGAVLVEQGHQEEFRVA